MMRPKPIASTTTGCARALLVVILIQTPFMATANVLGLFPAGPGCKSAAMETAGDCGEAQTLAYNPATMSSVSPGFAGELGIARLQYSYEHPSFDPVHINLMSPMFSEGWKGSLLDDRISWGFAVIPGSLADLKIKGLPRRVIGNVTPLNVRATRKQFHLPVGGSYQIPDTNLSLGASLLYTYDSRTLKGSTITNPNAPLVDMKAHGHFFRPLIGSSWRLGDDHQANASYMFPLTKKFAGTTKIAREPAPFDTEQVDYDPAVLMLNGRVRFADLTLSTNINHVFGGAGKNIQRDGLNRRTQRADLKDANHLGVRVASDSTRFGEFTAAAAWVDSYWGDGAYYTDEDGRAQHEIGQLFGQFNAIPVRNQSLTWRRHFGDWQTHAALFRSAGTTTVGPRGDNPGYYQIEFVSVTCGVRRNL
jgi:hypothetical protein